MTSVQWCAVIENSKECMSRECNQCKNNTLPVNITDEQLHAPVSYFKWKRKREERNIHGQENEVKHMEKSTIVSSIEELIDDVNSQLPAFLIHIFNIRNQYSYLKCIRDNLAKHEILKQIDFSEIYVLKFSTEIQAMHFGASKKQIRFIRE